MEALLHIRWFGRVGLMRVYWTELFAMAGDRDWDTRAQENAGGKKGRGGRGGTDVYALHLDGGQGG